MITAPTPTQATTRHPLVRLIRAGGLAVPVPGGATRPVAARSPKQHEQGEHDQHRRQHEGRHPVGPAGELGVDGTGECVVAHQRHRPEVGQRVQRHQGASGSHRRAHPGEDDGAEHPGGGGTQAARRLLQRAVDPPQRSRHHQVDIRIGEDGEREPGPGEAGDVGHTVDAEQLGEHAPRPERGDVGERPDVGGDHQRKGEQRETSRAASQVGPDGEPGGGGTEGGRRDGDRHHQHHGGDEQLDGAARGEGLATCSGCVAMLTRR